MPMVMMVGKGSCVVSISTHPYLMLGDPHTIHGSHVSQQTVTSGLRNLLFCCFTTPFLTCTIARRFRVAG
jgi:hypothetical protein